MRDNKIKHCFFYSFFLVALMTQIVFADQDVHDDRFNAVVSKKEFHDYISKGYIELGMSKDEVRQSWGEPKQIKNKRVSEFDEVWVYVPNWKFRNRLYFKDNILVKTDPSYLVVSQMEGHGILPKGQAGGR